MGDDDELRAGVKAFVDSIMEGMTRSARIAELWAELQEIVPVGMGVSVVIHPSAFTNVPKHVTCLTELPTSAHLRCVMAAVTQTTWTDEEAAATPEQRFRDDVKTLRKKPDVS